jgi:hypothetical protein
LEGDVTRSQNNPPAPAELVTVESARGAVTFWPYTGQNYEGTPSDPVNLIFAGRADPIEIRAALLALNGDRTALGFPPQYPFNATWSDAVGDVQVDYAEGPEWTSSVVQLQLGGYKPIRYHLRLFRVRGEFGSSESMTIGAAHFEVLIPGTADHQVVSWERAEEIVLVDFLRSGLLDPNAPFAESGPINASPSFREIPAVIYNGLPEALKAFIGGPPGTVSDPVPILTNGSATILNLVGASPLVPGTFTQNLAFNYGQVLPKPFCNPDGSQWVRVVGPVAFNKTVEITPDGRFVYDANYSGELSVTPWDIMTNQPLGDPYPAQVGGDQHGNLKPQRAFARAFDERIANSALGTESLQTWLHASSPGPRSYRVRERCP